LRVEGLGFRLSESKFGEALRPHRFAVRAEGLGLFKT